MLETGVTFSYGQLVMDNEFARMIRHALKGMVVSDETLAVEAIKEVGPHREFLSHESTYLHMRDQSRSKFLDRRTRQAWEGAGAKDMYQLAAAKAREILQTHQPEPLPGNVLEEIRSIVQDTEKQLGLEPLF